ncbi:MAG: PepSY-associated TM helix domain-containing protein [Planctomycetota bacterium]
MRLFRAVWSLHRWVGLAAGLVLLGSACTGLLLLKKKDHAWLQPPVLRGVDGPPEALRPLAEVYAAVFALGAPELRSEADIARVDFRPQDRVHKVVSRRGDVEVQVCAISLRTSGPAVRRSDWIERLHDGSLFGAAVHDWLMPVAALALAWLAASGYAMWGWPAWQRRRRGKAG